MGDFKYMPPKTSSVVFSKPETFEEVGQLCRHDNAGPMEELVTLLGATEQRGGL